MTCLMCFRLVLKDNVNVAGSQPTWQITDYSTLVSSRAVDNDPLSSACTFYHHPHPWWAVDIGQPANVKMVNVTNDYDNDRIRGKCDHMKLKLRIFGTHRRDTRCPLICGFWRNLTPLKLPDDPTYYGRNRTNGQAFI